MHPPSTNVPAPLRKEFAAFPAPLRDLVVAELAAGNRVVELVRDFPAPRDGACLRLEKHVTTRARMSSPGVHFREWNSLSHAGEFADSARRYFVVEPPHPHSVEKNMNSIREEFAARERVSLTSRDSFH